VPPGFCWRPPPDIRLRSRCKRRVVASKQFTIHDAPVALTIHLKRFSPLGRKIGHPVRYDERLSLEHAISDGQYGPTYSLYGVISHAGGGPNSGHYYAHVKASNDQWYEMNDESVTRHPGPPTSMKCAYILFYMRERGQALQAAVASGSQPVTLNAITDKQRKVSDTESNADEKQKQPIIPPVSKPTHSATPTRDPQADLLKKKIEAVSKPTPLKPSNALLSLSQYADEDDDTEDIGEKVEAPISSLTSKEILTTSSASMTTSSIPSIPPSQFYGSSPSTQGIKRKLHDRDEETSQRPSIRRFNTHGSATKQRVFGLASPFNRTSSVKNGMQGRYGKKKRPII
jgi:ubiquitin carboxyl-terminal hydrolase 36/42